MSQEQLQNLTTKAGLYLTVFFGSSVWGTHFHFLAKIAYSTFGAMIMLFTFMNQWQLWRRNNKTNIIVIVVEKIIYRIPFFRKKKR